MNKIIAFISLVLTLCFPFVSLAANQSTDATPTEAEVTTLIASMSTGETLTFEGDATWTSSVTVDKAIIINGNGHTITAGANLANGFFYVTGFTDNTNTMRITGFTFTQTASNVDNRAIKVASITLGKLRIDNNTFNHGYEAIDVGGSFGVIDHNHFYNLRKAINFTAGTRAQADASWTDLSAGTANALFIEDNHFIRDADYLLAYEQEQIGTRNGGKIVVRYNEFDSDAATLDETFGPFMAHGNADGGCSTHEGYWQIDADSTLCRRRAQSVIEFYNNNIHTAGGNEINFPFKSRGGVNLVYNNTLSTTSGTLQYAPRIYFLEEEYASDDWSANYRTAWPAEDQVHNSHVWGNTYNGVAYFNTTSQMAIAPSAEAGLQVNRDFFLHAPCGASDATDSYGNTCTHGKATFTGLNGASGSYPTNGSVYPTKGTMVFSSTGDNAYYGYVPYGYPHPLRLVSGGGEEDPALTVTVSHVGDGVTISHDGAASVLTGGSLNISVTRHNGWNGAWSGTCPNVTTCTVPDQGKTAVCSTTPTENCAAKYTATPKSAAFIAN